jgi:hypothetical protein
MKENRIYVVRTNVALLAILLLAACSSAPTKPAGESRAEEKPKPAELVTGREAFQKLYATARMSFADARPVRLESEATKDANGHDGKAAVWRTLFASASRRSMRAFVWSGISASDAPERGISHGSEETWVPTNVSTQPFDMAFIKVDSDAAYGVAQKHGGDKALGKDSTLPVLYILEWDASKAQLVWRVIYGNSRNDAKLIVDVDATKGDFIRVER